jgi:hypothetical protein
VSLQACREALEASSGDVDAATALIRGRQAPVIWCSCGARDDGSFAILLELTGTPSPEARGQVEALLRTALQADDDAAAANVLSHPIVRRHTLVRLPPNQPGLIVAGAVDKRAAAVVMGTESAAGATEPDTINCAQELLESVLVRGFRFAHIEEIPEPELAAWLDRARGTDADKAALLRTLVLSAEPEIGRRLRWDAKESRTLLSVHRLDSGSNAQPGSLRDVSPCLVPGPFVVAGRAVTSRMSAGALMDFSERVRRWGDDHRVAASLIAAGTSSAWHTLPHDEAIFAPVVVGIVVTRGPLQDCTRVDRALCLASTAALDAVPAEAWSELAGSLPEAERAQLIQAPNAVHVTAVGAVDAHLVFGKKGTGTLSLYPARGGGPPLGYYKCGQTDAFRASLPGAYGELIASAGVGTTAVADLGDAAHAARALRLPRMQYYVVPSFSVEPQDLR